MVSSEWLKGADLFETLEESQLNTLLSHSVIKSFSGGEKIFGQGDEAKYLYVLIEGAVDLTVKAHEEIGFMTSNVEKEGAVFGTPCLMEPYHYNVTATCTKPSKVLTIEADRIRMIIEDDPKMGMEVMKKLATIYFNRLNEMRAGVSNLLKFFKLRTP
jgi:CRP-like cAMP-binding protein